MCTCTWRRPCPSAPAPSDGPGCEHPGTDRAGSGRSCRSRREGRQRSRHLDAQNRLTSTPGARRVRLAALDESPRSSPEAHEAFKAMLAVFADPVVRTPAEGGAGQVLRLFTNLFQASDAQTLARDEAPDADRDDQGPRRSGPGVRGHPPRAAQGLHPRDGGVHAGNPRPGGGRVRPLDHLWWFVCTPAEADTKPLFGIGNLFGVAAAFPSNRLPARRSWGRPPSRTGSSRVAMGPIPGWPVDGGDMVPGRRGALAAQRVCDPPAWQAGIQAAVGAATVGFSFVNL